MDKDLENLFLASAEKVKNVSYVTNEDKEFLYGHYKQALFGDNTTEQPAFYEFTNIYKWNAWMRCKGMPNKLAAYKYISKVEELLSKDPHGSNNV